MILHELTANNSTFRPVRFMEGLNVILAEKTASSSKNDTRNGVGKTTLVEILMFCLGGQATKGKGIVQDALQSWIFTLEMTLKGTRVKVSRAIENADKVRVFGNVESWSIQPDYPELYNNTYVYSIERWRTLLGWALFDLDPSVQSQSTFPVPKGMLSCFIRLGQSAYQSVGLHNLTRKDGQEKSNLAYLLGLDWEFIGKIKELRQTLKDYRATKKVINKGAFSGAVGNVEQIRVEQIKVHTEIQELERSLTSYNFSPQYERLQQEVNELTQETLSLSNKIATNKRKYSSFQTAIREEKDTSCEAIEAIYKEIGLAFPDNIRQTLNEVLAFHKQIIINRKTFLADEITRLNAEIQNLTRERDEKSKLKAEKTTELTTQSIYEELRLRQNHLAELKSIENRQEEWITDLKKLDQEIKSLEAEIETIKNNVNTDFKEREMILKQIQDDFASYTYQLYGKTGILNILPEKDDYSISIEMDKGGSDGVRLMGIFCFDLALLKAQKRLGHEMSLLVHDTTIFDAVDVRQRALALELVARENLGIHGQYICTMNSDKVPSNEFTEQFDFNSHVICKLSDASPSDSLLGIHFEVD